MRDQWDSAQAPADALAQCVYGSRLLGGEPELVLHGGGNTSVKTMFTDITGEQVETLYVKGSGWDLANIEAAGFAPLRLDRLRALLRLERLSDTEMMNELRVASLDSAALSQEYRRLSRTRSQCRVVVARHAALRRGATQPRGRARHVDQPT